MEKVLVWEGNIRISIDSELKGLIEAMPKEEKDNFVRDALNNALDDMFNVESGKDIIDIEI